MPFEAIGKFTGIDFIYVITEVEMDDPLKLNTTVLAYMGDAVYEVRIRNMLVQGDAVSVDKLHRAAVKYVSCGGQAKAIRAMLAAADATEAGASNQDPAGDGGAVQHEPLIMTAEEVALVKRARNHRSMSRPRNADPRDYKLATGFEAWLGYLFLDGQLERMVEVVNEAVRIIDDEQ